MKLEYIIWDSFFDELEKNAFFDGLEKDARGETFRRIQAFLTARKPIKLDGKSLTKKLPSKITKEKSPFADFFEQIRGMPRH